MLSKNMTPAETAAFLRVALQTLAKWRVSGEGPPYQKFGRRVVYSLEDLQAWAANRRRRSTSTPPLTSSTPTLLVNGAASGRR